MAHRYVCCGSNACGEFGQKQRCTTSKCFIISRLYETLGCSHIRDIVPGALHVALITENDDLYMCGYNKYEQLGLGRKAPRVVSQWRRVVSLTGNVRSVVCGAKHTLVLTDSHQVFGFGDNSKGQLGIANSERNNLLHDRSRLHRSRFNSPIRIDWPPLSSHSSPSSLSSSSSIHDIQQYSIRQIAAGAEHSFILTESGELYGFGSNFECELGNIDPNNVNQQTPSYVSSPRRIVFDSNETIYNINYSNNNNNNNHSKSKVQIKQIFASPTSKHSFALTQDNRIFCIGLHKTLQAMLGPIFEVHYFYSTLRNPCSSKNKPFIQNIQSNLTDTWALLNDGTVLSQKHNFATPEDESKIICEGNTEDKVIDIALGGSYHLGYLLTDSGNILTVEKSEELSCWTLQPWPVNQIRRSVYTLFGFKVFPPNDMFRSRIEAMFDTDLQ